MHDLIKQPRTSTVDSQYMSIYMHLTYQRIVVFLFHYIPPNFFLTIFIQNLSNSLNCWMYVYEHMSWNHNKCPHGWSIVSLILFFQTKVVVLTRCVAETTWRWTWSTPWPLSPWSSANTTRDRPPTTTTTDPHHRISQALVKCTSTSWPYHPCSPSYYLVADALQRRNAPMLMHTTHQLRPSMDVAVLRNYSANKLQFQNKRYVKPHTV